MIPSHLNHISKEEREEEAGVLSAMGIMTEPL